MPKEMATDDELTTMRLLVDQSAQLLMMCREQAGDIETALVGEVDESPDRARPAGMVCDLEGIRADLHALLNTLNHIAGNVGIGEKRAKKGRE